jgi:hypothetical protein
MLTRLELGDESTPEHAVGLSRAGWEKAICHREGLTTPMIRRNAETAERLGLFAPAPGHGIRRDGH